MKTKYTLPLKDQRASLEMVGGKGASLARMAAAGLPVPDGFHVTTTAYRLFVTKNKLQSRIMQALEPIDFQVPDTLETASEAITRLFLYAPIPAEVSQAVKQAYAALPGSIPIVAVRSSATAEDLPEASFAGQQETYLNISGSEEVLEATRKCWGSLWTARAINYRSRQGISPENLALAVVIQLLVPSEAAGITFTANPVNGRRDQMVINTSWGLGEAIVGGLVTPDSLTLEKSTGRVIDRVTADKLVQTKRVDRGTEEQPVPKELRGAQVLNEDQAVKLVRLGNQIEGLYGMPMDIEWALADGEFAIVQARPITALPDPDPPIPTEWKLPEGAYAAMRNNIVELMADPLTPLFKTLGLGAVNTSMNKILVGFLGDTGVLPSEPIITVNEYAYYNGSVKFGPMMKIILDTRGILKRMFTGAVERWTEDGRPQYLAAVQDWETMNWRELPATALVDAVRQLTEAAIDAYGSMVSGVIPAAWMSEAWFTFTYKFIKRKGDPKAPTYLMGFESLPIRAEKVLYDLAQWTQKHPDIANTLAKMPTSEIVLHLWSDVILTGVEATQWEKWQRRFRAYLQEYGHMIYNLDFGNPVPADDPAPVVETFKLFLSGGGVNPHERQRTSADRREAAVQELQARLKGRRLKSFQKNLKRAQKYAPLREDGLADVGLSYPLVRKMLGELGTRLTASGMLQRAEDVFWLTEDEIVEGAAQLNRNTVLEDLSSLILTRKATWRAARRAVPPLALPQMKVFGADLMELKSGGIRKRKGNTIKGVAASPGKVTASACVIQGPEDFSKMKPGDVLVAPLTTPAWTPLFARAAAIVTDVGGPLSHGSIVAREYGIPAVLGTSTATKRIRTGQVITVDGSAGVVTFQEIDPIEKRI